MATKRRKTRKPRQARGLGTYAQMEKYSTAAYHRKCATAIRGYGDLKAQNDHESAAHVFGDIVRFCVKPQERN